MISSPNINFDTPAKIDTAANTQENATISSNTSAKTDVNNNTKDEKNAKDNADPDGFVSLLGHVISNTHQNSAPDSPATPAQPEKSAEELKNSAATPQLTNPNLLNPELSKLDLSQQQTASSLQNGTELSQQTTPISDNHALAWIDSNSFQSLSSPGLTSDNSLVSNAQAKIEGSVANAQSSSDKTSIDALTSDTDKNSLGNQFTEEFMQTLKTTVDLATVGGEKTSAAQKNLDSLALQQNTQANAQPNALPNQSSHQTSEAKSLEIPVSISNPSWGDKFAEQISWLGHQEIKSAVIKIHPEELGPIEIKVKIDKDSASVNIISHSSHVRDLVDQSIPRLREMMTQQGLNLSDVQVNSDRNSGQFSQQQSNDQQGSSNSNEEEVQLVTTIKKRPQGLIDYFA